MIKKLFGKLLLKKQTDEPPSIEKSIKRLKMTEKMLNDTIKYTTYNWQSFEPSIDIDGKVLKSSIIFPNPCGKLNEIAETNRIIQQQLQNIQITQPTPLCSARNISSLQKELEKKRNNQRNSIYLKTLIREIFVKNTDVQDLITEKLANTKDCRVADLANFNPAITFSMSDIIFGNEEGVYYIELPFSLYF